ncbi:MAG: ABC transporter ATP-binding protein/permease [Oscillospiraceae bacterium]|nr:ABC transporter ATP-binding protein/permease [Oscillospiraceae bacterium]
MLKLKGITKNYLSGDSEVQALKGIDVTFRKNEFVAVLGPSGCGKTTLLNIIGGLDRYTQGDLVIQDVSTKEYSDRDWDDYRNHTIGFVFQTYNLIPHQTVLANVELALTLSGVSKSERRERAKAMLQKVGLGDQIHKKPNQMSGGQMQRVAIARALINNPEILLADEPTGALDTETSVQIMDLLKEIAKDRLVIMVTHNPELAEQYSTRILRLLDGKIVSDSMPYDGAQPKKKDKAKQEKNAKKKKKKHVSMNFLTAGSLSLNNLMTKKARTFLTSFAGSIGIIGISLILSLSDGFQTYINTVQENTLSSYPLIIEEQAADLSGLMESLANTAPENNTHELDKVYISDTATEMLNAMVSEVQENDMSALKHYIEEHEAELGDYHIAYSYYVTPQIYLADTAEDVTVVNPNPMVDAYYQMLGYDMSSASSAYSSMMSMGTSMMDVWTTLYGDQRLLDEQYDVISGHWPSNYQEAVLVVDDRNEITDLTMYGLGLRDADKISEIFATIMGGGTLESQADSFDYDELLNLQFKLILNTDIYEYDEVKQCWVDRSKNDDFMKEKIENGLPIKISGIVRAKEGSVSGALAAGTICYTQGLIDYLIEEIAKSDIVKEQKADPEIDVFTGYPFEDPDEDVTIEDVYEYIDNMSQAELQQMQMMFGSLYGDSFNGDDVVEALNSMSDDELVAALGPQMIAGITIADAKTFAATDQGKVALAQAIAAAMGVPADPALVDNLSDEDLLKTYQQIVLSTITADQIRAQVAAMNDDQLNQLAASLNPANDAESLKQMLATMDEDTLLTIFKEQVLSASTENTYDGNLSIMGVHDPDHPNAIMIYSNSFEAKENFETFLEEYNQKQIDADNEAGVIEYTDYIGIMLSSVTKIINMISYVLIGFVSISLVVSSIMIGIITYISVLERTKEIGILRSIGASKRDISRVFNAETFLVGFVSGVLGVMITMLLDIPINIIIEHVSGAPNIAFLRPIYALILIAISIILTLIAGLVPSHMAAKKDPVIALRSE